MGSFSTIWGWREVWLQIRLAKVCGLDEHDPNTAYWRCNTDQNLQARALDHFLGDPFERNPNHQVGIARACLLPPYEELSQEAKDYLEAYWTDQMRSVVEARVREVQRMHQKSVQGSQTRNLGISTDALSQALGHAFMEGFIEGVKGRENEPYAD